MLDNTRPLPRGVVCNMDLNRIGDPKYMAELRAETMAREADPQFISGRIEVMEELMRQWGTGDAPRPAGLNSLSINEFVAVALALNRKNEFQNPAGQFFSLQPWLQAWVLRQLKLEKYSGGRIEAAD